MTNTLAPPSPELFANADVYRQFQQYFGALTGQSDWGVPLSPSSIEADDQYGLTLRNQGLGGHLLVQKSTDGSDLLTVTDLGLTVADLTVSGDLGVGGTATIGALHVTGNSTLDGTLSAGATTVTTLHATGAATLDSTLSAGASTLASLHVTGTSALDGTATLGASLAFSGTGARITGNFHDGTIANRTLFQDATANQPTNVGVIPNGTSTSGAVAVHNNSAPGSATVQLNLVAAAAAGQIICHSPAGSYQPLDFYTGNAKQLTLDTSGNLTLASGGLNLGTTGAATGGIKATNSISTTGGISAGASSSITGGLSIVSGGLTVIAGGAGVTGGLTFDTGQVNGTGLVFNFSGTSQTQTTVGAAGGASALPATPVGYLKIFVSGANRVLPFYNP